MNYMMFYKFISNSYHNLHFLRFLSHDYLLTMLMHYILKELSSAFEIYMIYASNEDLIPI